MAQVNVTIAGRPYRMACTDGEEAHLTALAAVVDAKIGDIRREFGEVGDQRISVMAALTIADELSEAGRRIAGLERALATLQGEAAAAQASQAGWTAGVAESLAEAASRIERVVEGLKPAKAGA